jgi:hypothetical protein
MIEKEKEAPIWHGEKDDTAGIVKMVLFPSLNFYFL